MTDSIEDRGGCEVPPRLGEWGVQIYDNRNCRITIRNIAKTPAPLPEDDIDYRYVVIHPDDAETVAAWIIEMAQAIRNAGVDLS